ncbi:hypothetical protein [Acaryochloris marina]|uniref:Uncharacterized protein n=1 Tax=Acaryochloris marina (strain MBIC 11017) TaxID=329726 RepID=A8ZMC8_ACAM1|nr:hypothetical protein [Acaryochloris marina]ABW32339.1 hypothetical protein AM1_C0029 [Acaryochloris marina MBIC11017]
MKGCLVILLIVLTPFLLLSGPIGWILGIIAWILLLKDSGKNSGNDQ